MFYYDGSILEFCICLFVIDILAIIVGLLIKREN